MLNIQNGPYFTGKTIRRNEFITPQKAQRTLHLYQEKAQEAKLEIETAILDGLDIKQARKKYWAENQKYRGPKLEYRGMSTPHVGEGNVWLFGTLDTPLSSRGAYNCALLNTVDHKTNKHFFYHVFADTPKESIEMLVKSKMNNFDRVNIMYGDKMVYSRETMEWENASKGTVENIKEAVKSINPEIKPVIYPNASGDEVVAYKGALRVISHADPNKMTFQKVANYNNFFDD